MKHEGRQSMSRRMRDELVKEGDLPTFWRQFWAHCDLRPEECVSRLRLPSMSVLS